MIVQVIVSRVSADNRYRRFKHQYTATVVCLEARVKQKSYYT